MSDKRIVLLYLFACAIALSTAAPNPVAPPKLSAGDVKKVAAAIAAVAPKTAPAAALKAAPAAAPAAAPKAAPAAAPVAAVQPVSKQLASVNQCSQGGQWVRYNQNCYLYHEQDEYWYVAEQECKKYGGHLVSIADENENSFVAKLTYCESAFTGRYAIDVDKLSSPTNYRWTDGTASGYYSHDFTSISSIHEPLISVVNLKWRNNVYHSRDRYICKAKYVSGGGQNGTCDPGWTLVGKNCYLMPQPSVMFIEANFYCSGRAAHLVTIYSEQELRALSLLDLESKGCPAQVWVGLIKLNPCREDFATGKKICYKWADREEEYHDGKFPAWHPGSPDEGERTNCVLLQDRAMRTVDCYERHRFICKKPARF